MPIDLDYLNEDLMDRTFLPAAPVVKVERTYHASPAFNPAIHKMLQAYNRAAFSFGVGGEFTVFQAFEALPKNRRRKSDRLSTIRGMRVQFAFLVKIRKLEKLSAHRYRVVAIK